MTRRGTANDLEQAKERFLRATNKQGPLQPHMETCCWEYRNGKDKIGGYGRFWFDGKTIGAHTFVGFVCTGVWPDPANHICHICDYPPCVRPSHLVYGSRIFNIHDSVVKGRHSQATLSSSDVAEIKNLLKARMKQTAIAAYYNVWQSTISDIANGRTWNLVP